MRFNIAKRKQLYFFKGNTRLNSGKNTIKTNRKPHKAKRIRPVDFKDKIVLFNKPYDVLCQFTDDSNRKTLQEYIPIKDIYAAGRLDKDSEGLLLLTNNGQLQHKLADPKHKTEKVYWVQVEGCPTEEALDKLRYGVTLKDGPTLPAKISVIVQPNIWQRVPPIRERAKIPTTWLSITITEGKNRQVRRMTAHIGYPTLRLIRYSIGKWTIDNLPSGEYQEITTMNNTNKNTI